MQMTITSITYKARSHKVGYRKYIGIVDKITEHELSNGFQKTEIEEIVTIGRYNKYVPDQDKNNPILFPLACDKQAKRAAIKEMNRIMKGT